MQKNSQGEILYLCYILSKTHSHGARLIPKDPDQIAQMHMRGYVV